MNGPVRLLEKYLSCYVKSNAYVMRHIINGFSTAVEPFQTINPFSREREQTTQENFIKGINFGWSRVGFTALK